MPKKLDLVGKRFGRLVVLRQAENYISPKGFSNTAWFCKCDCGNECIRQTSSLLYNETPSCGCVRKEKLTKHNLTHTKSYHAWTSMKQRCYNENAENYKDYGGRGIKVCDTWLNDFIEFHKWSLNNGFGKGMTLDRIDVNGNYEPSNCRWISNLEQQHNKRTNVFISINGVKKCLSQWAELFGISRRLFAITYKRKGYDYIIKCYEKYLEN